MDLGVDRIFEDKRGQQVGEMLVLLVGVAHLDVEHVEADHCVMDQINEALDILHYLREELLVLGGQDRACLVDLIETEVLLDGLRLLLDVLQENLTEAVLELDDRVIIHGAEVGSQRVDLHRVLGLVGGAEDTEADDVVLHEQPQRLLFICQHRGVAGRWPRRLSRQRKRGASTGAHATAGRHRVLFNNLPPALVDHLVRLIVASSRLWGSVR